MTTNGPIGFWSYTHRDNELEDGRIRRLAVAIQNEYELLTGDRLSFFVDKATLEWGDEWRRVIDGALAQTAFFIPILTPNYLRSEECRREFISFAGRAAAAGVRELILPLLYIGSNELTDADTSDEVARLAQEIQREDWRELRLADENSRQYRAAVNRLATRLAGITTTITARPLVELLDEASHDAPGTLDEIALAEERVMSWEDLLTRIAKEVTTVGQIVVASTEEIKQSDARGGGARGRIFVLNKFATELAPSAALIETLGTEFGRSAVEADPGVQAVIRGVSSEAATEEELQQAENLFNVLKNMVASSASARVGLQEFVNSIDNVQSMARVIRTPLRQLRHGLSAVMDAQTVLSGWTALIDEASANSNPPRS